MNKNGVNFYKYNYDTFSRPKASSKPVLQGNDYRSITGLRSTHSVTESGLSDEVIAPQGIGEIKNLLINKEKTIKSVRNPNIVGEIVEAVVITKDKSSDRNLDSLLKPSGNIRNTLEREIRKRKKVNADCPFKDKNGYCSALFIRCGERAQYAYPETLEQRNMPHMCLYKSSINDGCTVIIDFDQAVCSFCKTSLELFFHVDSDDIKIASSGRMAFEILKNLKLEGKRCDLLICSQSLPDMASYKIINDVFNRNYNANIILTWDEKNSKLSQEETESLRSLMTRGSIVNAVLQKPFHSDTFIETIEKIKKDRKLSETSSHGS